MSDYTRIRCKTCEEEPDNPDLCINRGERYLHAFLDRLPTLLVAHQVSCWEAEVIVRCAGHEVPMDWLAKHQGHDLAVFSEYGEELPRPR